MSSRQLAVIMFADIMSYIFLEEILNLIHIP